MSDTPQGPDWWQASDDKWYPPPRPEMPGDAPAAVGAAAVPGGPPTGPPMAPPGGFPSGPPSGGFPAPGAPGPYGPPSGAQPPGSAQNKTPLYIAIGAVAVALVVLLVVVLTGGDDGDDDTTSPPTTDEPAPTTETTDGPSPTTTESGGGGGGGTSGSPSIEGLEVTESGFAADNSSYGFIVTNSADEARIDFTVDVAVYDTTDTLITNDTHTVARLNAGETIGIGYDVTDDIPNGISRLEFRFEEGYEETAPEGSFTVSGVTTETDDYGTDTTFTVASTYQEDIDTPYAYAIYRDAGGAIIGGTYGFVDLIPAGGQAQGTITSYEPVQNVSTTEVYVDAGYFF